MARKTYVVYKEKDRDFYYTAHRLPRKHQLSLADTLHSSKASAKKRARAIDGFWSLLNRRDF